MKSLHAHLPVLLCALVFSALARGADLGAPTFVSQPRSTAIRAGGTLRLDATVTGAGPMAFAWIKDGAFLSGATNVPLSISNTPASAGGIYALVAVNAVGASLSSNATVFVDTNRPCNFPWRWEARLHGTSLGPYGTALDVAVDRDGNTFAVGFLTSGQNGWDWVAAKFDRTGEQMWMAQYDGPKHSDDRAFAVALDVTGNCYVTGISSDLAGEDYLTIKYDGEGKVVWTARQNIGQPEPNDEAYAIAVDPVGNAYVSGDNGTLGYDSNGIPRWTNYCRGDFLKLTADGSALYVLSDYGCGLAKLGTNGSPMWQRPIPSPVVRPGSRPARLAVDALGNAYVAGSRDFNYGAGKGDIETVKFDADGNRVWTAVYNNTTRFWTVDAPDGVQVDESGCVYVAGSSLATDSMSASGPDSSKADIVLLKYDPQGQLLWASRYNGPHDREDYALDLQVDAAGGVYVCGYSGRVVNASGGTVQDGIVIKYDPYGNELWVSRYLSPKSGNGYLRKLALDAAGNPSVVGEAAQTGRPQAADLLVLKFDQRGPLLAPHGFTSAEIFQCCLVSPPGSRLSIHATSDFENWQPVTVITNLNGLTPIFDFEARDHQRFYRAVSLP